MIVPSLAAACSLLVAQGPSADPPRDPTAAELEEAWNRFGQAPAAAQQALVDEVTTRVEACDDQELRLLLGMRDRAAKELQPRPARAREFHDPKKYGVRVVRAAVDPSSAAAAEKRELYKPWENAPPLASRVTWDLGRDEAIDAGAPVDPLGQLESFLNGYPPRADLLVAWVERKFDFDESLDARFAHFEHVYCDLDGHAFPEVTLYDAFSSGSDMDMPDVEVIAYARGVLKDDSFVSPIPPDAKRQRLYIQVGEGFLACFRYRVWIEAAANTFVRPEAPIRGTHEGLRSRLLDLFGQEEGDLERVAKRLKAQGDRGGFLAEMDSAGDTDPKLAEKMRRFCARRAESQWAVARIAYAVMREQGMLAR
jgi:hypothetical protein